MAEALRAWRLWLLGQAEDALAPHADLLREVIYWGLALGFVAIGLWVLCLLGIVVYVKIGTALDARRQG